MDMRVVLLILGLTGTFADRAIAGQHEGHQAGAADVSATQVAECRRAQPVVTELLNAALKRLEEARLTNNAAAMRDAADDVQAALVDMRTQLAPCTMMQAATVPPTGHAMPGAPSSSVAPAEPPAAADAHGGHSTPSVPQTPASRAPATMPARPATSPRAVAPAAADSHAGHAMPAAPSPRPPSTAAARPSTPASAAAPAHDAQTGDVTPAAPTKEAAPAAAARPSTAVPPTNIAGLKCSNPIDPRTAPRMLYQGRMYYFCTEASRAEFAKEPAKFVTAPPQAAPAHAH